MRTISRFLLIAIFSTVLAGIVATSASAASKSKLPVITSVSPRSLAVGEKLTIRGKNFRKGPLKTTVAFYRKGRPIVFLKAQTATSTKLTVLVTEKVQSLFKDSQTTPRLIRLRILTTRLSKSWTKNSRSVTIDPVAKVPTTPTTPKPGEPAPELTCEQRAAANAGGDEDKDLVNNSDELRFKLNPCVGDSDSDGVSDGFEAWSAVDLNYSYNGSTYMNVLPDLFFFNGRRPSPNPLDPADAGKDFDGDGLSLSQEYQLWVAGGAQSGTAKDYSDGKQRTFDEPISGRTWLDLNGDGKLTDDERDFDGDNISNQIEFNMAGQQEWWDKVKWRKRGTGTEYEAELPYTLRTFSGLDATAIDSDGDGLSDGQDDQDNDGWSNFLEMQYTRAELGVRVQAFNPCLPQMHAINCSRYRPFEKAWPPFDGDDTTAPTVIAGEDYNVVRWPYNLVDGSVYTDAEHPLNTTLWDGETGLQN